MNEFMQRYVAKPPEQEEQEEKPQLQQLWPGPPRLLPSVPPQAPAEPVKTEDIIVTCARYAIYGGVGYLVADTWFGGRGLIGAGVGLVGGYMVERLLGQYLLTEQ